MPLPITREFYLCICNHSHAFIFKACLLIILMLCISISQSLNQTRICNTNKEHSNISSLRLLDHQQITMYIVAFFFFVLWDVYMWLKWSHISLPRLESVLLGWMFYWASARPYIVAWLSCEKSFEEPKFHSHGFLLFLILLSLGITSHKGLVNSNDFIVIVTTNWRGPVIICITSSLLWLSLELLLLGIFMMLATPADSHSLTHLWRKKPLFTYFFKYILQRTLLFFLYFI